MHIFLDYRYNLDTRRPVSCRNLSTNPDTCYPYKCIDQFGLKFTLQKLDIKSVDVFLDIGSGKGLPLLIASQFPFKKIIGVEISKELCEIAKKNVDNYLAKKYVKCKKN